MKLGDLWRRIRLRGVSGTGERPVDDNVDALSVMAGMAGPGSAPTNWVPSQQDERPQ